MRRVLVAAALWWGAALSLACHPALDGAAETTSRGCSVHEDGRATPAQSVRAVRAARCERRVAGSGAPLVAVPFVGDSPARVDDQQAPRGGTPPARASLVSSVTRAPRAPPRS